VSVLGCYGGMEQHLPEQIAEFLAELVARAALDGVDHFMRLLDEVGHQVAMRDALRPRAQFPHCTHGLGRIPHGVAVPCHGRPHSLAAIRSRYRRALSETRTADSTSAMRDPASTPRIA